MLVRSRRASAARQDARCANGYEAVGCDRRALHIGAFGTRTVDLIKRRRIVLVSQEMPPETGWGGIGTYSTS